ncbi:DUF3237 domain-containing protein [Catalinimonas sp. 4WD22]|uniref:DUF3237 domain-containing protein n=1 Tax=Catalinimonas locisalis TaxID=3133978 RepID=UPI003100AA1C
MEAELEPPQIIGATPGGTRRIYYAKRGSFQGPQMTGELLSGGGDWSLNRTDGTYVLDVRCILKTEKEDLIYVNYRGYIYLQSGEVKQHRQGEKQNLGKYYLRTAPFFETSSKEYDWLNRVLAIGVGEYYEDQYKVSYNVYQIS